MYTERGHTQREDIHEEETYTKEEQTQKKYIHGMEIDHERRHMGNKNK